MSSQSVNRREIPIVYCPSCQLQVLRLVSKTENNPRKVFYKCPNYKKTKVPPCKFFMWEKEYKAYLVSIGLWTEDDADGSLTMQDDGANKSTAENTIENRLAENRIENRLADLMEQLKRNEKCQIVESIEKIKFLVAINTILMFNILVIMLVKLFLE